MDMLIEFEALTRLIQTIPRKAQRGLFTHWVDWTCIDVTREYLAIGADCAIVFLVDRSNNDIKRLNCKIQKNEVITSVKMCHSVDYVVAAGTKQGTVYIFQLPSPLPGRPKEMRQFLVPVMHHSPIRALAWSQNAMKLYTGDEDGVVACTELNYDDGSCKAYPVWKEPHEIVQLDYMYRTLLVSTRFRCLFCFTEENNRTLQIGRKERKILGPFGATFIPGILQPSDAVVFTARPGLRLWRAGMDGVVQSTCMCKEQIQGVTKDMDLLSDTAQPIPVHSASAEQRQFGPLLSYESTRLVTWYETALYVLEPGLGNVAAYHLGLGRIKGVAVCDDEIFVLRDLKDRPIIRIAEKPDLKLSPASPVTLTLPSGVPPSISGAAPVQLLQDTATSMSQSIVTAFNQVSEKIQSVQEGERPTATPPPWGYTTTTSSSQDSIESPESAKESPLDSQAPSVQQSRESVGAEQRPAPGGEQSMEGKQGKNTTSGTSSTKTEAETMASSQATSSEQVKPRFVRKQKKENVVYLDQSDELIVVHKKIKKKKPAVADTGSVASLDLESSSANHSRTASPLRTDSPARSSSTTRAKGRPNPNDWPEAVLAYRPQDAYDDDETLVIEAEDVVEDPELKRQRMLEELEAELTRLPTVPKPEDNEETPKLVSDIPNELSESKAVESMPIASLTLTDKKETVSEKPQETSKTSTASNLPANESPSLSPSKVPQSSRKESLTKSPDKSASKSKNIYKSADSSSEDFYSQYHPTVPVYGSPQGGLSIEDAIQAEAPKKEENVEEKESSQEVRRNDPALLGSNWLEFVLPGSIQSLCVNDRHVWIVDTNKKVMYSALLGPGLRWQEIKDPAEQLTTSPCGAIVWRVWNNSLYVATKVSARQPTGTKWVEAAREVAYVALDDRVGWYCKLSGEVWMQKELSRERPCYRALRVTCEMDGAAVPVVSVTCHRGVVWALTKERKVLVRRGVTARMPEGTDWEPLSGAGSDLLVSSFELGAQDTAWVVDVVGRVWFTPGVTAAKPHGTGQWWQVSLSEYLMNEASALATVRSILVAPAALAGLLQRPNAGGLVAARTNGLWLCPDFKNVLFVCKSGLLGHRWELVTLDGIVSSVKWHNIMVETAQSSTDLLWTQQPNASIFVFSTDKPRPLEVPPPYDTRKPHLLPKPFQVMTGCAEAVWGLMEGGEVYIRTDITRHCPQGLKWVRLDLSQLDRGVRFCHLSCGGQNVWAVSSDGVVYLRIGVLAPSQAHLNPVWVPVEGSCHTVGARFVKVYAGSNDWMVWAIDSKNAVYVRKGITDSFPLGTHWFYVPGPPATQLTVSERLVYAVTAAGGELMVRHGIADTHPAGSHWKKIPGAMQSISVTPQGDEVWGVNKEQQLCRRYTLPLQLKPVLQDLQGAVSRGQSVEEDWEML